MLFVGAPMRANHLIALLAVCIPGWALAQSSAAGVQGAANLPAPAGATQRFTITGFKVTGDNPLSADQTNRVLAPFVGNADIVVLQQAMQALENAFKAAGYELNRVSLSPQNLGANVELEVVRFAIGKIEVEGDAKFYSEANVRAGLPELKEGEAPNFRRLSRQSTLSNENPGKQVRIALRESEEADKIDVRIALKESDPVSFAASLSNTGSSATGNDRLSLVASHANLFGRDHQASVAYTTSLERIREVTQLGVNYRVPLYQQGGLVGFSFTRSDVVGSFGSFTSTGAGQTMGVNYNHYFEPQGARRTYLTVGLDQKRFIVAQVNGVPVPGQVDRVSRPLSVGYAAKIESDTAVWGYNAELAANLPGGEGNDLAAYKTEDTRIDRVNWWVLRGGAQFTGALRAGWLWSGRTQWQIAPQPLISGEQFGIGGSTSVRGTGERPLSGDSGLSATVEISTPELAPGLRLLGFVDGGWLTSRSTGGTSKVESDQLTGAGLGLRYADSRFSVNLDWARILRGSELPAVPGAGIPKSGDDRVHLNVSARF
ncbi:MAG: ShlB/FhaC/HecB family hemolysin secretion/activation protein [Rhodoferax sp.]|nr:ShlB/FhaC/HecB family hemolysin secretion/activation protein [Rhodoferax sp.]